MSTEERTVKGDALKLLESIDPALTSRALADTAKTAESIDTVRFMFHPWVSLPNISNMGPKYGVNHTVLKRLNLIPITTWKVPVFLPKASGWAPGSFGTVSGGMGATHERPFGEFYPSGSVGPKISSRLQFPSESVANLLVAYGIDGLHDIGMVQLESLVAQSDKDKVESILLFKSVMDPAQSVLLEDLPEYLRTKAVELLAAACQNGVRLAGRTIPMSPLAPEKGDAMLVELRKSVQTGIDQAEKILSATKSDLTDAKIGVKDVKRKLDDLDKWLLAQLPSYSMDSELERGALLLAGAQQANAGANAAAVAQSDMTMQQMMAMQQQTLDALKAANETNQRLADRLMAVTTPAAQEVAPPPAP